MTQTKWFIAVVSAVPTLFLGFTFALLMPETVEGIRSTLFVASHQWQHGEVPVETPTTEDQLRAENTQLKHYLSQAEIDLGDAIGLIQSEQDGYRRALDSVELHQELSETLIQSQISRPMLLLAPTPQEVEDELVPEVQAATSTISGTPPKQQGGGS